MESSTKHQRNGAGQGFEAERSCPVCPREGGASKCWVKSPLARRLGAAGVLFFLIKGLAWLVVPAVLAWTASR